MTKVELHVTSILVDGVFSGDIPDDVLVAAKNARETNSGPVREKMFEIGDRWVHEPSDEKEILLRSATFDHLCGIEISDRFTQIVMDDEIGPSGGRKTSHIYDSNIGTGLSRQGKTPRDL